MELAGSNRRLFGQGSKNAKPRWNGLCKSTGSGKEVQHESSDTAVPGITQETPDQGFKAWVTFRLDL